MNFLDLHQWIEALYEKGMNGVVPRLWIEDFGYTVTFSALAAGGTATQILSLNSNQDFVHTRLNHRANVAAAGQTVSTKTAPLIRLQITEVGSGNPFFAQASDLENISANNNPERFKSYPRWLSGNSSLSFVATNYDAAQTYNLDIFFEGVRVRAYSDPLPSAIR